MGSSWPEQGKTYFSICVCFYFAYRSVAVRPFFVSAKVPAQGKQTSAGLSYWVV